MLRGALVGMVVLTAGCTKATPVVDAGVEAAAPVLPDAATAAVRDPLPIAHPRATSPFSVVATFAEGVTPNAAPLGAAVLVTQFGPVRWTLSAVGADHKRVDMIARIPPPMRPLDEQPMFVGGTSMNDVWISTATGTLHVTPKSTTTRTGHILGFGPLGGGLAALMLDGEERSLDWLARPDAGALPTIPAAHRLSDDIAFLGEGRVCGRSHGGLWISGMDGFKQAIRLDKEHSDAHVYRGPKGECMLHAGGESGTFIGRLEGATVAWTKIAPSQLSPTSATKSGSLIVAMGDELVRVSLVAGALTLTGIPLPDDAKRVTTLAALDDDDIWFTGPKTGSREALFHTAPTDAGAPTAWPAP